MVNSTTPLFWFNPLTIMMFAIPEGFEIPPELEDDGTFTVLAQIRPGEDGRLSLVSIDGSAVADEMEDDEEAEAAEEMAEGEEPFDSPDGFMKRAAQAIPMMA